MKLFIISPLHESVGLSSLEHDTQSLRKSNLFQGCRGAFFEAGPGSGSSERTAASLSHKLRSFIAVTQDRVARVASTAVKLKITAYIFCRYPAQMFAPKTTQTHQITRQNPGPAPRPICRTPLRSGYNTLSASKKDRLRSL